MKEKTDLLREAIEKEFTLELNPLLENFNNDFNSNIRTFYLEAKANHDLINHEDDDRKRQEQTAFKNLLQQQYTSQAFKDFFKDLSLSEYALEDKIVKLYADERTIDSFLIQKNSIKGSPCDFFSVCLGVRGWKNFKPNNIPKRIEKSEQDIQEKPTGNNGSVEKNNAVRLSNIPNLEIEDYVPRVSIIEEISNLFEQKNKKINISGISGNGKTFLARHFVQHYSEKFSHIVWLNCSEGLSRAFTEGKGAKLLDKIGLSAEHLSFVNGNMKVESLIDMLLGRLQSIKENSILVLDNVNEEILFYDDELNLFSDWKILTTSQESLEGFFNYAIPSFEEEALKLFYKYYTLESDDENLIRLLSSVEYHTLTIELLAKTAQQRQITIIGLVNRFIENGINVVEKVSIIADHNIERKNRVERKTKIENIEEYLNIVFDTSLLSKEECKILLNIAILQSEPIVINLFKEVYLNDCFEKKVIDIFEHNISILRSKGWIQIDNDGIRLHNLVKSIIVKKFIRNNEYFDSTIKYLENILAKRHLLHDLNKMDYLKLSESVLENITNESKNLIYLQKGVSSFYAEIGLYEKSKEIELGHLNKLLEIPKSENESENLTEIISQLHNLSVISTSQGNHEEAVQYSEQIFFLFSGETRQIMQFKLIDALTSFFKENKINNAELFESKFNRIITIQLLEIYLSAFLEIVMYKNLKEDLHNKIEKLLSIISIRTEIISLFEMNIPEKVILSIEIYKKLLLGNDTVFHHIGRYYIKLKEYNKAEEFIMKALKIEEKILDNGHHFFSSTYSSLTLLYIKREDLEKAKYYLEKNREICDRLPQNSPYISTYKESLYDFEELQHKQSVSGSLKKAISKFDIQNEENQNAKYYNELSSIYFEHEDYEKANEYITKEIDILLNTNSMEFYSLFQLYLKSGQCYLHLNDLDNASQLYNKAVRLCNENKTDDIKINKEVNDFKEILIKNSIKECYLPIISPFIKERVKKLGDKYINIVNDLPTKTILSLIINEIFELLFTLPDLKNTISEENNPEEEMISFIEAYDFFIQKILKESKNNENTLLLLNNIQYDILDEYYQTIINLFVKYGNWKVSIQYYFKRLFINEKYFEVSESTGSIYFDLSVCYFNSGGKGVQLALDTIHNTIQIYSMVSENCREPKESEEIKTFLKDALNLEKLIKEELKKYRN